MDLQNSTPTYLSSLNEQQLKAVKSTEGPLLVLAGAGTGKTKVLTTRLAHLLFNRNCNPQEILAVTFTNRAAREMKDRVGKQLNMPIESLWIGTFHSIGARILRSNAELAGLKPNFTILDSDDQLRLLKQIIIQADIDEKSWPPRLLASIINNWKDKGIPPEMLNKNDGMNFANGSGLTLYEEYQKRLIELNAADFGDLLLHNLSIFKKNQRILQNYMKRFRYILVDEYQDTNLGQYQWLKQLANGHNNICCVGDDDQSIYSWRGAEVGNILRFEEDFDNSKIIRLEQNYRSSPSILGAASALISMNKSRLGKTLWTDRKDLEKVNILSTWDGEEEARIICEEVNKFHEQGTKFSEFSILVRASFQTREFEERMLGLGIPYRVIGGLRFYEHKEIRDIIAYLRVISQPEDDLAFERILNVPKRGIGNTTLQLLRNLSRQKNISLYDAVLDLLETNEITSSRKNSLNRLIELFSKWRNLSSIKSPADIIEIVLEDSGYINALKKNRSPDIPGRLENLKELIAAIEPFETLVEFLEHISLVMENNNNNNESKISIMTLHSAKGLEFSQVYLPGWEEDLFPHPRALDEGGEKSLEEERRLAHVAITRARDRLTISFAASRRVYSQWRTSLPSRFINELPSEHIEFKVQYGSPHHQSNFIPLEGGGKFHPGNGITSGGLIIDEKLSNNFNSPQSKFQKGERIFHQKFGYGLINKVQGNRLEVNFEKAGLKKVIDSFVQNT